MKIDEKSKVTISLGILYASAVACVCAAAVAATSYVNILNRLDRIAGDSMTHGEFQSWVDSFREANPPLHVPAVPQKRSDAGSLAVAVIARTDTKTEE